MSGLKKDSLNIGDLVRWKLGDTIADVLGQPRSRITGIIVRFRQLKAQVLCKTGSLCWYPVDELKIIK